MNKSSLTIIMITLNEEYHLAEVIDNVSDIADNIFIVDSLSSDRTVDIALEKGVTIIQRPFTNFGDQWNFAIENCPFDTEWTLKLDPDERLTDELKNDIRNVMNSNNSKSGYEFRRRLWFMGKPIHVYHTILRLWKTGECKFSEVLVNEHPFVNGEIGYLNGLMEHFDSKDLHHWLHKQNKYSSLESNRIFNGDKLAVKPKLLGNRLGRIMFVKNIFYKLPFKYTIQFFHELFVKGAIKNGFNGVRYTRSRIFVRRLIEYKLIESKRNDKLIQLKSKNRLSYDTRVSEETLLTKQNKSL